MPTDPTTKSQVQAYRFMLRRMESALVRKDAAMVHEPMRNHLTATVVGLVLGALGLAAFFVVGMFSPTSQVHPGDIVISKTSSAVYVVQDQPRRLVPVLNLASARLLVAAFNRDDSEPPQTKWVDDAALAGFNRAPITGLVGAPPLPSPQDMVPGPWAVCDTAGGPDDPSGRSTTTVLIGAGTPGRPLAPPQALLLQATGSPVTYLVHDGQRNAVNLTDPDNRADAAVKSAYHLETAVPHVVSPGLLNAIPEGRALTAPRIPGLGDPLPFPQLRGHQIGDVVRVDVSRPQDFLLLAGGKQRVSQVVGDVLQYANGRGLSTVAPEDITQVPDAPASSRLDFGDFPTEIPQVLSADDTHNTCLSWVGQDQPPALSISPDPQLPLGPGRSAVDVPGGGSGLVADRVFVAPNKAALVRNAVPGQQPGSGSLWLVTEGGLRYRIPSAGVARALGLGQSVTAAPQQVLGLLPLGPELDPQRALELYDPVLAHQQQGGG